MKKLSSYQKYQRKLKRLKKQATILFQQSREPFCKICGKEATVVHHIIPKSRSNAVRFDLLNAASLCQGCHFQWHNTQDPRLYEKMRPRNYKQLQAKSRETVKTNIQFYEEAITRLKKM